MVEQLEQGVVLGVGCPDLRTASATSLKRLELGARSDSRRLLNLMCHIEVVQWEVPQ